MYELHQELPNKQNPWNAWIWWWVPSRELKRQILTFVLENREKSAVKHYIKTLFYLISWICLQSFVEDCSLEMFLTYLLKPVTSQNEPKPAKTSQINCKTTWNDPKFQNLGNLKFSTSFRFSNFELKSLIWAFWTKKY